MRLIFLIVTYALSVLGQAAPLRSLPDGVTDLDHFRVQRYDRGWVRTGMPLELEG